ncbi:MAG TPA: glycogen debranching enzyme, partial [Actinomycetota bacterium]|nr:glycogen debranching enzyme [Actinomycetota bacterium]
SDFAYRVMGSSDLYEATGRRPSASVNFVTAHDGFTLADLTSYNEKHNEANGEDNNDGESHNRSWNCGAEGPTVDPEINQLRNRMRRNLIATLLLSQGIPMVLAGDEFARSQQGNNNAYCQDNEISWFDWETQDTELLEFTRRLIAFRQEHPVFRRPNFFQGRPVIGHDLSDLAWFRSDGVDMDEEDWQAGLKTVGVFLNGQAIDAHDQRGEPIVDDSFLVWFNAHVDPVDFTVPPKLGELWTKVLDTDVQAYGDGETETVKAGDVVPVPPRTILVFQMEPPPDAEGN